VFTRFAVLMKIFCESRTSASAALGSTLDYFYATGILV
jgi:hypothetical protein